MKRLIVVLCALLLVGGVGALLWIEFGGNNNLPKAKSGVNPETQKKLAAAEKELNEARIQQAKKLEAEAEKLVKAAEEKVAEEKAKLLEIQKKEAEKKLTEEEAKKDTTIQALKGDWPVTFDFGELPHEKNLKGKLTVEVVKKEKDGYSLSGTYENSLRKLKLQGTFTGTYKGENLVMKMDQLKPVKFSWSVEVSFPLTKEGKVIEDAEGEWAQTGKKTVLAFRMQKKHAEPKKEGHPELFKALKDAKGKGTTTFTSGTGTDLEDFVRSYSTEAKITEVDDVKNVVKMEIEVKGGRLLKKQTLKITGSLTGTRFDGEEENGEPVRLIFYKDGDNWRARGWYEQDLLLVKAKRLIKLEITK